MPMRAAAAFVALASAFCFWLVFILGIAGGATYSVSRLIADSFSLPGLMALLVMAWGVTLSGALFLRNKFKQLSLTLSIVSPLCGLVATANELWNLHLGTASLEVPEGEAMWIYMPRLTAAALMLGITLLGLAIQFFWGRSPES